MNMGITGYKFWLRAILAIGFSLCIAGLALAQDNPKSSIVPERFLRGYDPITVLYDKEVGPAKAGPANGASPFLTISPSIGGEYRWLDRKTIQFLPSVPWPALRQFSVLTKGGSASLSTLMVPPNQVAPNPGSRDLEPFGTITLNFPSVFDRATIARMLSVEIRDLPGLDARSARFLTNAEYSVRELEQSRTKLSSAFQVNFKTPVTWGKRAILHIKLSLDESIPGALAQYSFDTRNEFRLVGMGSRSVTLPVSSSGAVYDQKQIIDCGSENNPLWLEFSDEVSPFGVETLKRLVRFEPAVRNLRHEFTGNRLMLYFDADRDRPYRLSVDWQAVKAASGQALSKIGATSFWFYYRQAEPFISWRQSSGIIERYGPQFLPMEGRGVGRLDLRVHKIDPLSLNFWPFPENAVTIRENSRPPMPGEEPAYGYDLERQLRLLNSPEISRIINLPVGSTSPRTVFGIDMRSDLAAKYGAGKPGTYLVAYRTLDQGDERHFIRINVTDLCLSSVEEDNSIVFVASSLKTGAPLAGVSIRVEAILDADGDNRTGKRTKSLIEGVTDQNGQFRYSHGAALRYQPNRIVATLADDILVMDCRRAPPAFANNHWSNGGPWLNWLTDRPREVQHASSLHAWMISERPIYRPEESVHLIGFVRNRQDGILSRAANYDQLDLRIQAGDKTWDTVVKASGTGRYYYEFKDKDQITGNFRAELRDRERGIVLATANFKKEAYRVPQFEVNLSAEPRVPIDKPFKVLLTASYYSGGRVVGETVQWKITQLPYSMESPGLAGYVFASDPRNEGPFNPTGAMNQSGVLDGEGSHSVSVDPSKERDGRARRYVFEATVQGADRQTVTQTHQVVALPPFSIGLKLPRLSQTGLVLQPQVVAIDYLENLKAGVPIGIRLYQREWHSYIADTDITTGNPKYVTDVIDSLVEEKNLVSAEQAATVNFNLKGAGVYLVEIFTKDSLGRRVSVKADCFVPGNAAMAWDRKREGLFEISPDKDVYNPGDTAQLLFKSPYQTGSALVVVEKFSGNVYSWVPVTKGQGLFKFAIDDQMAPGVPVTVLLQRGRSGEYPASAEAASGPQGLKLDFGKPASVASAIIVPVSPRAHQAVLTLNHQNKSRPSENLKIKLNLNQPDGSPLEGEVALWLVDKAVLSLGRESGINPLGAFIDPARSWLSLHDSRNLTIGGVPVMEVPGGDGDEEQAMRELMDQTTVRKNFQTVPYFKPDIQVKNGQAEIEVPLPDNLTDFAIRAIAVSGYNRFGSAKSSVSVRKPVIVQSALPRFIRPGDSFEAGGLARVVEGDSGPGLAGMRAEALQFGKNAGTPLPDDPSAMTRKIAFDGKKAVKLLFPLVVPLDILNTPRESVAISLFAQRSSDGAKDAFRLQVPVKDDAPAQRQYQAGTLRDKTPVKLGLPSEIIRPGSLKRTIVLARDARIVSLLNSLRYLSEYPHGCVEQRVSRMYPGVSFKELLTAAGMDQAFALNKAGVQSLVSYLSSAQDGDGLFGYWPGSTAYVSLTAYVVEFLAQLKKTGIEFDEMVMKRAIAGLRQALRSDSARLLPRWSSWERVEALAALTACGAFDPAYAQELLQRSENLYPYSQARLLSVLADQKLAGSPLAKQLANRVEALVFTKLVDKQEVFGGLQDKTLPWGGPVLASETKTIAAMVEALVKVKPESKKLSFLSDWLINAAGVNGWGNTQDDIAAMRAIRALLVKEANQPADLIVTLVDSQGKSQEINLKGRIVVNLPLKDQGAVSLMAGRGVSTDSPVFWSMHGSYSRLDLGSTVAAHNAGFNLERQIQLLEGGELSQPVTLTKGMAVKLNLDQVVEESLTLTNFSDREFVAVIIPLAAGLEPLNSELATAPPEAKPQGIISLTPNYAMYLDDKVVFYYDRLPKGSYNFYFRTRASFSGSFSAAPAQAECMYDESIRGNSAGAEIRVGAP